jgi:ABC-2 type transport system permease protein
LPQGDGAGAERVSRYAGERIVSARVSLRHRLVEIWRSRELLVFLVRKELKVKYKNSVLGFAWSMLNPALVLMVYYVVFTVFLRNGIPHFALFLFAGLLGWNLFNNSLMGASGAVVSNAGIIKKVAFPREILALSQVGTACVFFFFQSVVLLCFFAGFAYAPDWPYLTLIPLALIALVVVTAGLAVFLSAVNVHLRDTQHLIEVVLQAWFWAVPIVYSFNYVYQRFQKHTLFGIPGTHLSWLYLANPVTPIVLTFQRALYGYHVYYPPGPNGTPGTTPTSVLTDFPYTWYLGMDLIILAVGIVVLIGALALFGRIEGNFAEEL